jgi:CBS domain-containing protein
MRAAKKKKPVRARRVRRATQRVTPKTPKKPRTPRAPRAPKMPAPSMTVDSLMTRTVAACREDQPVSVAAKLMWDCDCGSVPVVDGEGRVIGMITDRDICMAAWMQNRPPSNIPVWEAMSREVYTCAPSETVAAAERLMCSRQVRRLPVVDEEHRLVGILSLADLVRQVQRAGGPAAQVVPAEVAATLAEICQPREAMPA